jgi:cytoskeletal protein RodZ
MSKQLMAHAGILGVRTWRQQKGISLESIAASTKLSVRQLDAIENGDFNRLPGGIYNTSYIKQYARAIGFDERDLLAYYTAACNPPVAHRVAPPSPWLAVLPLPRA